MFFEASIREKFSEKWSLHKKWMRAAVEAIGAATEADCSIIIIHQFHILIMQIINVIQSLKQSTNHFFNQIVKQSSNQTINQSIKSIISQANT